MRSTRVRNSTFWWITIRPACTIRSKPSTAMNLSIFGISRRDRKPGTSESQSGDPGGEPAADGAPKNGAQTAAVVSDQDASASAAVAAVSMRRAIVERLYGVIDPELGINIVDLGLIYHLYVDGSTAEIRLTMTTPACPMSSYIKQEVGRALQDVPGLRRGVIELVWDPFWGPSMIDYEGRLKRMGVF